MAYAPGIASSPDDLASQLERLFDRPPDDDEPIVVTENAAEAEPDADADAPEREVEAPVEAAPEAEPEVIAELTAQLDLLRDQLDEAFEEVVGRVDRVELRLANLRHTVEGAATATGRVEGTSSDALLVARQVLSTLEKAVATSQEPLPEPEPVDLGPIERLIDQLGEAITAPALESRVRIESGLEEVQQQLDALRATPVTVDTRHLEEAAKSGSLHNAADIANLRQDIADLADTVRQQAEGISELRTTLDWIKERLLLR